MGAALDEPFHLANALARRIRDQMPLSFTRELARLFFFLNVGIIPIAACEKCSATFVIRRLVAIVAHHGAYDARGRATTFDGGGSTMFRKRAAHNRHRCP